MSLTADNPSADARGAMRSEDGLCAKQMNELEAALAEKERIISELRRKNEEIEQFNTMLSHDLRSPLHTISGFSEIMIQDLAKGQTTTLLPDLKRVMEAAQRMQNMLDEILALSRAGRVLTQIQTIRVGDLVAEVLSTLKTELLDGKIKVSVSPSLPAVNGEIVRLRLALRNLLENSLKSVAREAEPCIEVSSISSTSEHTICIRDNGLGYASDRLALLFQQPSSLGQPSDSENLGLVIVRRVVEAHGGKIWVQSEGRNKGASFFFTIPVITSKSAMNSSP